MYIKVYGREKLLGRVSVGVIKTINIGCRCVGDFKTIKVMKIWLLEPEIKGIKEIPPPPPKF